MKRSGAKMVVALMLIMAMMLAMLCAAAEDTGLVLVAEEAAQSTVKGLTIEGETAVPSEVEVQIGEPSPDGVEDAPVINDSRPEDFEIKDGVLVKYVGPGGDVVIPDGVTSIGGKAFYECADLTSVTIPNGVTDIGGYAFYECVNLVSATIPNGVTVIGECAFSRCRSLASVTIPDSVTYLGIWAFSYCSGLRRATIGSGCRMAVLSNSNIFHNDHLDWIDVTPDNKVYTSRDGELYSYNMKKLLRCPVTRTITVIPSSVTTIGTRAFSGCDKMVSVTIPSSVDWIDNAAFVDCDSLMAALIPPSVYHMGAGVFRDCDKLTIYGKKGSEAEAYAKENDIPFEPYYHFGFGGDPVAISECKITVEDQVYTGKALKPEVTVKHGKKTLKKGKNYTVTYKNNKAIGIATVTVKGKGEYFGAAKVTFRINPKAVTGLKLKAGEGVIDASWKKAPGGVSGYQLEYGLKKNFSDAKKMTVKNGNAVKRTLSGLESGKTYYVRIRAYKKVDKETFYSDWSSAQKAKVK